MSFEKFIQTMFPDRKVDKLTMDFISANNLMLEKSYQQGFEDGKEEGLLQQGKLWEGMEKLKKFKWLPIEQLKNGCSLEPTNTDILFFWPARLNLRTNCDVFSCGSIASDGYIEVEGWTAGKLLDDMETKPTHFAYLPQPPQEQES